MPHKAHLAGISFATMFGFSFMFSKIALEYVSPMGLVAYRFTVAAIAFETLRRLKWVHIRFERSMIRPIFWVVFFQPILYFIFEINGLNLITSAEAGMMIALIPVFGALMSGVVLKEPVKKGQWGFIGLSVFGILFIQWNRLQEGFEGALLGFVLVFISVLAASAFNIASRLAGRKIYAVEVTYFMMIVGALFFNLVYGLELVFSGNLSGYLIIFEESALWFPIVYLGLVASIMGFFLVNYALRYLSAPVASIYANLATIVSILAGALILGESLFAYHAIGSAMILLGVTGTVRLGQVKRYKGPQPDLTPVETT